VIVAVSAAIPLTTPVDASMDATALLLLIHVPPPTASANVVLLPVHTLAAPVITGGNAFTVTTAVTELPDTV
jgi:hypothetical protein